MSWLRNGKTLDAATEAMLERAQGSEQWFLLPKAN
jgi:hypothetical protein